MSPSAFILCATPGSGSTLLGDLLTASGAGQPQSYFRSEDIAYWAARWGVAGPTDAADPVFNRAYLAAMARAGRGGSDLLGLRFMWDSVEGASRRLDAAAGRHADLITHFEQTFGSTLFIQPSRLDKAAQAASLVRAEQTGLWHRHADGTERGRVGPARSPAFDRDRLAQARDRLRRADDAWSDLFVAQGGRRFASAMRRLRPIRAPPSRTC